MEKKWYVVHTYSGHEKKVKRYLDNAIINQGYEEQIDEVLVPIEEVVEMKGGKRMVSDRKFLPSYILINMDLNRDTMALVTSTPGVTSFVSSGSTPQPLKESEIEKIRNQMDRGKTKQAMEVPFRVGDAVKVIDGPFSEFSGVVNEVNVERGKLKVMVSIFGRSTPVELDFLQVKSL
ncbi:transcription termination/antitermination protein NusG [Candidatus Zixiibacteriota bacterium]